MQQGDKTTQFGETFELSLGGGCEKCDLISERGCKIEDIEAYKSCLTNIEFCFIKKGINKS